MTVEIQELRPIRVLRVPDLVPAEVGRRPEIAWLPLASLRINDAYQRSLSDRSMRSIRKMIAGWDWARVKALSVMPIGDGLYEVIDGQHTAHAAASHGGIDELPCLIAAAASLEARAGAFVGINRDRVAMTPLQIFWADVAAGDEDALDAVRGVELAGGRILRHSPGTDRFEIGDIMSAEGVKRLARRGGVAYVRRVVGVGVAGKLGPIKDAFLRAVAWLIWDDENSLTDDAIVDVIRIHTGEGLLKRARALREEQRQPLHACLATVIKRLA